MIGTVQFNRTDSGAKGKEAVKSNGIQKGQYNSLFYQHKDQPLTYAIWTDNNFVKVLSNFHQPKVSVQGVKRKRRGANGRREHYQTPVDIPLQTQDYCETYHLIDKGNGAEAKYDLGGESKMHGWSPKLTARLFNMNLNNAYKIYCTLVANEEGHSYKPKGMRECIQATAHSLLQQG